jgi:YVTN family beta-propeller protein
MSFANSWARAAIVLGACAIAAAAPPERPIGEATTDFPGPIQGGFNLPNGWRITPAGEPVADLNDLVLKLLPSPDGRVVIAVHSGYLPHGLSVIDARSHKVVQEIRLKTTWLGLAWSPDGRTLYVSGGNANGEKREKPSAAPVYALAYHNGRLDPTPIGTFNDPNLPMNKVWWAGVLADPKRSVLYAANRGTGPAPTDVVQFDAVSRQVKRRLRAGSSPYELQLSKDGRRLFVSNWGSRSVSVIDTDNGQTIKTIPVGANPNDMVLAPDGRLFVACSNDNTVHVIDTKSLQVVETLSTALYPQAPEGSTPNALALDARRGLLFVANADNNDVAVIDIRSKARSEVLGFIPTGWYPSALTVAENGAALYVGVTKGEAGHPDLKGPGSPLASNWYGDETVKTLQRSNVERVPLAGLYVKLKAYTRHAYRNSPYNDALLTQARPSAVPTIIPDRPGVGSPIKHVIYIIKENRTYDQVFGDLAQGNGDPRLAIFGRKVSPNHHALAEEFALFDNCYTDGDVSQDGHSWSDAAYATDQNEKTWPANYGGHSQDGAFSLAYIPSGGYLWDAAQRKGLTYRSYGEYATRVSTGAKMGPYPGITGLIGHVAPDYRGFDARDPENAKVFLSEFDEYERNFDSADPAKRLPNFVVMALPEDHTRGTEPGAFTPKAMMASNDYALGQLVERISHSRYWPETAIFVIEDDAQDGPDHVDARRTVCLAISPYIRRGSVDHTLYTTSSMVRSMELLLGLPPMSQYDAAATPFYAAFGVKPDLAPYALRPPEVDLNEKNTAASYGAAESARMDFTENDRAPMRRLNEIIWKSVRGEASPMPAPVHRYRPVRSQTD